jgi:hypothetical protein
LPHHTAVIHVEFESQPGGPAPEAIADEIAKDIDALLDTDSSYAPVTSHLADVLDEAVQVSPTGRWRIRFYLEPPMEQVVMEKDRTAALEVFERVGYGEQAHVVSLSLTKTRRRPLVSRYASSGEIPIS